MENRLKKGLGRGLSSLLGDSTKEIITNKVSIKDIDKITPNSEIDCEIINSNKKINIKLLCRIDTIKELDYYRQGGILQYVLNSIIKKAS